MSIALYNLMRIIILLILFSGLLFTNKIQAQNSLEITVIDSASKEPVPGAAAIVKGTNIGAVSDATGNLRIDNIPNGPQTVIIQSLGFRPETLSHVFPYVQDEKIIVYLVSEGEEVEEIIVEGTRSNRSIANIPTRVEVLTEEIDEASTMDPSKIAHLLTHSTGIQVQQTSATSNTANVRIQGLDGRYTQILKDGFPIYGGFSGSLSIMQIPPLDLRQIEYIKGSASTLYGGGAIAGLINLLSKTPDKEEILFHINASHIGAFDVNSFYSNREGKIGITLLAQRNTHRYFDADKDGYSDMPRLTKYNFNPKLFFYLSDKTRFYIGSTFTDEVKEGGDTWLLEEQDADSVHFYREQNDIRRVTTQFKFDHDITENSTVTVRNSFNIFDRRLNLSVSPALRDYSFGGNQLSSFSEISYSHRKRTNVFVTGLNFVTEKFTETPNHKADRIYRNEDYKIAGAFGQYTFDIGRHLAIESGIRTDYVFDYDFFILPRASAIFKWTDKLSSRIGGGLGYRMPTLFNQEAEVLGYAGVHPLDMDKLEAERSYGGNIDIGYRTKLGENYFIQFNQMVFYTHLDRPLILAPDDTGSFAFENANGYTQSRGAETFFKFGFYDFVLFVGYTFTDASNHFDGKFSEMTLTPKHSLKGDLLYSLPGKWRIGVDYEYKSAQTLSSGRKTRNLFTSGAIVEYTIKHYTFFGNAENITDVRQTRYESLVSGPHNTPQFTEVWAPLDGFVFNAGIKVRL